MDKKRFVYLLLACVLTLTITAALGLWQPALATTTDWAPNHPGMYGGRVTALAFSPIYATDGTIYAGTYDGGIFRSLDSGLHWQIINNGLDDWTIWDLAVSPNFANDPTLFAATAGRLYKSSNGGDTWTNSSNGLAQVDFGVQALTISPNYANDKTVFAGTDHAGVFRSIDGGSNWITVTAGLAWQSQGELAARNIKDLAISPNYANDRTLFAATLGGGVFRSNNGGDLWTAVNSGLPDFVIVAIVVSPNFVSDQVLFAATVSNGVYRSANAGDSWTQVNSNLPSLEMSDLAITPDYGSGSVQTLFAALDHDGVVKSMDDGATWQSINTGLPSNLVEALVVSPAFATDQTLFAGMGSGGGLYKSTNSGNKWSYEVIGITSVEVTDLVASPNLVNDNIMFAAGYGAGVFRSEDRGSSWMTVNTGITVHTMNVLATSPAFADDETLYAGTFSDGIFRTINGGNSWINVGPAEPEIEAIVLSSNFATDNTLFTATNEGIFKSINRGDTWSPVNNGLPLQNGLPVRILSLVISPDFSQDHSIFAGTDANGVYRSNDDGASWTPVNNGMGEGGISVLAISPNYTMDQTIYAAKLTDGFQTALYLSTDGGNSWIPVDTALLKAPVTQLVFSPNYTGDRTIYVGTHFDSVYYSKNNGPWQRFDAGIGLKVDNIRSLAVVQMDTMAVFVGTSGSGVWRYDINDIPLTTVTPTPGPVQCPTPAWNALIYLNGDNDLDYWTDVLFNKLEQAAHNPCVRIFALWDRSGGNDTDLYWVQPDDQLSVLALYTTNVNRWPRGEQDMGNPQTLINFAIQVRANFPAPHTFLSIVDHGNGWSPSLPPGPVKYKHAGMSFDDSSGGAYLSTESLAGALGAITDNGDKPLDLLFFDACLMGMAENLHPLRNFVSFLVASENETFSSYPYDEYLQVLDASTAPRDLATHIVEQYANSLSGYPYTMAAYDLSRMTSVSTAVDNFAHELIRVIPTQRSDIQASFNVAQKFDSDVDLRLTITDTYVDIYHFAQLITEKITDTVVQTSAQALMNTISGTSQSLVLQNSRKSEIFWINRQMWNTDNAYGLSIYLPLSKSDFFLRYYGERELTFARDTAWDEFIRSMIPTAQGPAAILQETDDRAGPIELYTIGASYTIYLPAVQQ